VRFAVTLKDIPNCDLQTLDVKHCNWANVKGSPYDAY